MTITKNRKIMKRMNVILAGIFILLSTVANAQTKTGFEYFKGKWSVVASAPTGDVRMIVGFEKSDTKVTATIKNPDGKELYKVLSTTVIEKQATIRFIGSQGEVDMVLKIKDENSLTGDIMGFVSLEGVRLK